MGYEMGFSICKKGEGDFNEREVACLDYWCSEGRSIKMFVDQCTKKCNFRYSEPVVLTEDDLKVIRAKLNSAYSGSDVVGEATMEYIFEGINDYYEDTDMIVARARKVGADVNTVLMAAKNFYWACDEMSYSTFISFREFINGIANMNINDGYELVCWVSD